MVRIRLLFPWALGLIAGAVLLTLATGNASFLRREDARLHAHFARVLRQLEARDVSGWSETRQANRRQLIALLQDYDRAGRFPRNEGHLARKTPIFVDRHAARCAMAYLIERSGGAAIVARIAATRNLEYMPQLANDAGLVAWLGGSGLTLDEAARIQPEYQPPGPGPVPPPLTPREEETPEDGVMTTGLLLSVGLAVPAIYMNLRPHATAAEHRQVRAFGMLVAVPALAAGIVDVAHDGHLRGSGIAQLSIGATSLALALLNRTASARAPSVKDPATKPRTRTAPIFRAGMEGEAQVGFAVAF